MKKKIFKLPIEGKGQGYKKKKTNKIKKKKLK